MTLHVIYADFQWSKNDNFFIYECKETKMVMMIFDQNIVFLVAEIQNIGSQWLVANALSALCWKRKSFTNIRHKHTLGEAPFSWHYNYNFSKMTSPGLLGLLPGEQINTVVFAQLKINFHKIALVLHVIFQAETCGILDPRLRPITIFSI